MREFAVMKATGASNGSLLLGLALQAIVLSLSAAVVAADVLDLVTAWRATAFRNAERLQRAPTPREKAAVASEIEDNAAVLARSIQLATTYSDGASSRARDAHCQSRRG